MKLTTNLSIDSISRASSRSYNSERLGTSRNNNFGLSGVFIRIKDDDSVATSEHVGHYEDEAHWPTEKREQIKKVRFVVCTLALLGMALGLMSRLMLNVSIVEMVKKQQVVPVEELNSTAEVEITTSLPSVDLIVDGEETFITTMATMLSNQTNTSIYQQTSLDNNDTSSMKIEGQHEEEEIDFSDGYEDGLHFNWTKQEQNMILGAFYIGYSPGILFGGNIAEMYGSKWPLFTCVFGTGVINLLTPFIAGYNLQLLILSRIFIGAIQGGLFPSLYDLFNKWLTRSESSIFAPMIKVSMPMGSLIGTLLPGVLASFGLEWPLLFYIGGGLCLVWSVIWFYVATSTPQKNRFVEENELKRIMRKKHYAFPESNKALAAVTSFTDTDDGTKIEKSRRIKSEIGPSKSEKSTPWIQIISNSSVLALTLVKFTYNCGMDFVYLELALYLREVHNATIETISAVASGGYCMQMVLITFVGWLAKYLVGGRVFGFGVTRWRKIFQGGSNLIMAVAFILLATIHPGIELASFLLILVCFSWMLGAGGESMVPYDLSNKYPASIVAFTHSVSISSGLYVPTLCGLILGEDTDNPNRWSILYNLLGGSLILGGLVFCLVLKAKPFLPEERDKRRDFEEVEANIQDQTANPTRTTDSHLCMKK